jgi:hypothetical protein
MIHYFHHFFINIFYHDYIHYFDNMDHNQILLLKVVLVIPYKTNEVILDLPTFFLFFIIFVNKFNYRKIQIINYHFNKIYQSLCCV